MGTTGSGKSSFVNTASGGKLPVGEGLQSCTSSIDTSPAFNVDGKGVVLIDTPGFDDTTRTDTDILSMISVFLAEMYRGDKKLAGIIYLHRISDVRVGGISARSFRMFRKLCGEESLKNVVIVTTRWSEVSLDVGEAREKELITKDLFFKTVLEKGARMVRYDNTPESAHSILKSLVDNVPLPLLIQTEVVDENKNLGETAAGSEVNDEIVRLIAKHEREIKAIKEEMEEEFKIRENAARQAARQEVAEAVRALEDELARLREDRKRLTADYATHKGNFEQKEKDDVQAARKRVEDLERAIRDLKKGAPPAERKSLQRQLADANKRLKHLEAKGRKRRTNECTIM
ncbi:hypothetical protein E1B28_011838 [Marasmius oreades]|nr:uncharacterized protein E1B28_011838 [Marasmius oreades]KAG7090239.1 hypothetical protein E1B28_011838 [Marasmius oreades]